MKLQSGHSELSVVVATYNRKGSLLRLLLALARQSLDPKAFEVIVVNDGSDDGTDQALAAIEVPYSLHVIRQANQGQAAARQSGALKASGRVLLFLDDDMEPCTDLLSEHVKAHEKDEARVVLGHIKAPPPSFARPNFVRYEEQFLARLYENIRKGAVEPSWEHFYTGNVSIPRRLFFEAGGFDLKMRRSEDIELGYRLSARKVRFNFALKAESIHYSDHRSFLSWLDTAYQDGIFRVKMFRNALFQPHPAMDYHRRHPLNRLMLKISIGSDRVRNRLSRLLRLCGDTLSFLELKRYCYYAYSAIHTVNYFAGIRDEMGGLAKFTGEIQAGYYQQPSSTASAYRRSAEPLSNTRSEVPTESDGRVLSLDILRGLFLLIMTLGFTIEPEIFPAWMYHRQFPPPEHVLVEIPGITWRDLAYPAFLFIMAAALPITISKRIERGIQGPALILAILKRGALLFLFALLIGHADSDTVGEYGARARVVGVAGFAIMFMIFTRRLPEWNARIFEIARAAGWPLALAFLILSPLLYHQTFSFARRDQIIEDLAFAAVAGSVLWYVTRSNAGARLVALGLLLSAFLWAQEDGRLGAELSRLSLDTLVDHLQLLAVVVPGTIAGDLLLRLLRSRKADHEARAAWSTGRLRVIAALGVVPTPILLVGLYNEWVGATSILVLSLIGAGTILVSRPATQTEQVVRRLVLWASFWLALGILLQPLEGGMKKVPGTFSYFFTMSGNTFFLLAALAVLVDLFGYRKWMGAFKKVGQNPMLCYVLFRVFLDSALDLVPPIGSLLHGGSPVEAIVRSFTIVLIVTVVVRAATERRILWRT